MIILLLALTIMMSIASNSFAATVFDPSIEPVWNEVKRNATEISYVDTSPKHIRIKGDNRVAFLISNVNTETGLLTTETWDVKLEGNEYYGQQSMEINRDLKTKKVLSGNFLASPWKKLTYDDSIYHCLKFLLDKKIVTIINKPSQKELWTYLGVFVLRKSINPTTDVYILNHLTPYNGSQADDYLFYDVYYQHDHATDEGTGQKEYSDWAFNFKGKVLLLDKYGNPLNNQGIYSGEIVSDISLRTKGSLGVSVNSFIIYDPQTGKELLTSSPDSQRSGEEMYMNTAAAYMLNMSAPHPVAPLSLRGYREFPYK